MIIARHILFAFCLWVLTGFPSTSFSDSSTPLGKEVQAIDAYTLKGPASFLNGYPAANEDGSLNAVIEIPAGTNAKWEVTKPDGLLKWEMKNGKPRIVQYLPYPANYGMIPRTLLPKENGGDGDPLDILVLGPALPRGSVVAIRLIGVLRLLDDGEQDDKLIAVWPEGPLGEVADLKELGEKFPGIREILQTWFSHYKGPGRLQTKGFGDLDEARKILEIAIQAFPNLP